jgi:hypothetical protein
MFFLDIEGHRQADGSFDTDMRRAAARLRAQRPRAVPHRGSLAPGDPSGAPQVDPAVTIEGQPSALAPSSPGAGPAPVSALAADDPLPPARPAWSWPDLLRHTFAVDVLACPRCGGRMRVVATIEDRVVIRKILTHLGLPTEVAAPGHRRPTLPQGAIPLRGAMG